MADFNIPLPHLSTLKYLAKLTFEQRTKIKEALIASNSTISTEDLSKRLTQAANISEQDASSIASLAVSLGGMKFQLDTSDSQTEERLIKRFSEDIINTLRAQKAIETDELAEDMRGFIASILTNDKAFWLIAKGKTLGYDHENLYLKGKLISDIRPVFGKEITNGIEAAVIVHQLKLVYRNAAADEIELFLALSSQDLTLLKENVERALLKDSQVKNWLALKQLTLIDFDAKAN